MKRHNRPSNDEILVLNANSALAVGKLDTTGNSVNLANGQIAVMSVDHTSATQPFGDYLVAGNTAAQVKAVKVLRGTPASSDFSLADKGFEVTHKAYQQSGELKLNQIRSVMSVPYKLGTYSTQLITGITEPAINTLYSMYLKYEGVKNDRYFSPNKDEVQFESVITPNFTTLGITAKIDWLLSTLGGKFNVASKKVSGNRNVVVLGINTAGNHLNAVTLGSLAKDTAINFLNRSGNSYSFLANTQHINTIIEAVAADANLTASSTIETIDNARIGEGIASKATVQFTADSGSATVTVNGVALVSGTAFTWATNPTASATSLRNAINNNATLSALFTATSSAGIVTITSKLKTTAANAYTLAKSGDDVANITISGATFSGAQNNRIDALLFLALDHEEALAFDDIKYKQVSLTLNPADGFVALNYQKTLSTPTNSRHTTGLGRDWKIEYDQRVRFNVYGQQVVGFGEEFITPPNYIDVTANYDTHIIEYWEVEPTLTKEQYSDKRLIMLTPAALADDTNTVSEGYTYSSSVSTALSSLNGILGAWVASNTGVQYLGASTSSTPFN